MYNSPITIIESTIDSFANAIIKQKDDAIFAEIQHSFGVDLDKGELIRALQYDRNQYEKGYADGKRDAQPKWIPVTERLPESEGVIAVLGNPCEIWTFNGDYWEDEYGWLQEFKSITHWMPLPEAPKED